MKDWADQRGWGAWRCAGAMMLAATPQERKRLPSQQALASSWQRWLKGETVSDAHRSDPNATGFYRPIIARMMGSTPEDIWPAHRWGNAVSVNASGELGFRRQKAAARLADQRKQLEDLQEQLRHMQELQDNVERSRGRGQLPRRLAGSPPPGQCSGPAGTAVTFTATRGRPPETGVSSPFASTASTTAFARAAQPGYLDWLSHVWPAGGCANPVRLRGASTTIDTATGEILRQVVTADLPDGVIYKPCGNRRACECPSCAETYRRDAFQAIRSGLTGGKAYPVPCRLTRRCSPRSPPHRSAWSTPAGSRPTPAPTDPTACASPCPAMPARRRTCPHGRRACYTRHAPGDPLTRQPLCPDCYDHDSHVVWNNVSRRTVRRSKQAAERHLATVFFARQLGLPLRFGSRMARQPSTSARRGPLPYSDPPRWHRLGRPVRDRRSPGRPYRG